MNSPYDQRFFQKREDGALRSARTIVPIVRSLINVESVIDVGCGTGSWLSAFQEAGASHVLGMDGDYVVSSGELCIAPADFKPVDLRDLTELPPDYDLVVCLEVLEHLPDRVGRNLIKAMTAAVDVVIFSAAVPGQRGTHHINEQWHDHWHRAFADCGFRVIDCLRPKLFACRDVQQWYRQNIFVYANEAGLEKNPRLAAEASLPLDSVVPISAARLAAFTRPSGLMKELARHVLRFVIGRPIT